MNLRTSPPWSRIAGTWQSKITIEQIDQRPRRDAVGPLVSAPGPYYTPLQLAFVSAVCLGLYIAFLFIQTGWHRAYFLPIGEEDSVEHAGPSRRIALASLGMLFVALLSVVLLV